MNARAHSGRHRVARPTPSQPTASTGLKLDPAPLIKPMNDHGIQTPAEDEKRVDPLWMISVAGALLFVFLALAAAFD